MKRLVAIFLLGSLVVLPFTAYAQRRKPGKAVASTPATLAKERGVDQITAAQMSAYLSFIASDEMEGRHSLAVWIRWPSLSR